MEMELYKMTIQELNNAIENYTGWIVQANQNAANFGGNFALRYKCDASIYQQRIFDIQKEIDSRKNE